MSNLKHRLNKLEKQIGGAEMPDWVYEIERNGPKNDNERMILAIQRDWGKPGLHPFLECLTRLNVR